MSTSSKQLPNGGSVKESIPGKVQVPADSHDIKQSSEDSHSGDDLLYSHVLLCFEDSLRLCSTKSLIQVFVYFLNFLINLFVTSI